MSGSGGRDVVKVVGMAGGMARCRWFAGVVAGIISAGLAAGAEPVTGAAEAPELAAAFERDVQPLLQTYCVDCHNVDQQTSGIRVDQLTAALEDRHLKLWEGIQRQLAERKMPPEKEAQPTDEERARAIGWMERGLRVARLRPTPRNGSTRRLTVAQYRNTLRELLLLEDDVADVLPADAVSKDGFVNQQETLNLSPLLLETCIEIAEQALDRCLVDETTPPTIQNFRVDLGEGRNPQPLKESLILGADSLLLSNGDFEVQQLTANKPFPFTPYWMPTKFRFIEGYQGNDTVRDWRDFDSVYHSVFACMRGTHGYPKGRAYAVVPEGLLLRPAIPSGEIFGVESTYGPRANFKISLRELPDHGRFRVTVTAARYNDGLLLDASIPAEPQTEVGTITVSMKESEATSVQIPEEGVYQIEVPLPADESAKTPPELTLQLGDRRFIGTRQQPAFLVVRLPQGALPVHVQASSQPAPGQMQFTRLTPDSELLRKFVAFESRSPRVGVHLGLRRDCGSTLSQVGTPQTVSSSAWQPYVFEGAIRNFPSPDVEKDNVNYLAGIREIGVRSEYTDGRDMPQLLIRSVEFEGPFYDTWPPATHQNIFIASAHQRDSVEYADEVIRRFAERAYRRPLQPEEHALLLATFEKSRQGGSAFRQSIQETLLVVLTSPQFLMITESSATPAAEPLDDYELASKLSYFLWNGPPDEPLLQHAAQGSLRQHLDSELQRMLVDARFSRFTREFVDQWLALDKFRVLEPDRTRFPALTRHAREQLQREPSETFQFLVRQNRPVRELLAADFIVANEVVASYYDLPQPPESGFEFVPIPHQRSELGGLFGQAALMAGLSDGRESNPVKRGTWVARRIVAEPPDDPPPNVPALREDNHDLSLRERLERHRNQAGCVQCHLKIDPWGVALEQFDAGGRFKTQPVDAQSLLPDGTTVQGLADLKRHLTADRADQVAFSVLKHLTIYANGRSLSYGETDALRQAVGSLAANDYRLQDMLRYVVQSDVFLTK